ncbi:MAG: EAL domain-containing protein [Oscillospiraceae bacterium]
MEETEKTNVPEQNKAVTLLRCALEQEQFCFYLQPKVDLVTGAVIGAEALARRLDNSGEVICPDEFLPTLEETGLVVKLDLLILRQVCRLLADRLQHDLPVTPISVNLSRLHIRNPDTAKTIHEIASSCGIPAELLEFELTETILLDDFTGAQALTEQLHAYGYKISIDDFGAGYAGINIWQELDFDVLKLDKRFLSQDERLCYRNEALVPGIVDIGHRLGAKVLCEGVETRKQCEYLLRIGCTMVQGYYFSKPIPPEKFFAAYEETGGHYPVDFSPTDTDDLRKMLPQPCAPEHRERQYARLVALSTLLLAMGILGIFCLLGRMLGSLHTLAAEQPTEIAAYVGRTEEMGQLACLLLILSVVLVGVALLVAFRRFYREACGETRRYALLAHFSDTVLFDYDCRADVLYFTSNAHKLFHVRALTQLHPLAVQNGADFYEADRDLLVAMLSGDGQTFDGQGEIRIRLLRPDGNGYFWCLCRFQYIYEDKTLITVIGKLTAIDVRQKGGDADEPANTAATSDEDESIPTGRV